MRGLMATVLTLMSVPLAAQEPFHRATGPAPAPGTIFLYPERIDLGDGRTGEAERGWLFVPVNRADTSKGVIAVDVWRFAAQEATSLPPIVRLHGGPGWEGLDGVLDDAEDAADYWDRVVGTFTSVSDLIVVGQRGIGSSKPNTACAATGSVTMDLRACRAYWEERGLDLTGFSVVEAAADVRDAAHALGHDSIIVWGGSFGSHWGMALMRYHPHLVARAVLTGMEGPDHTYDRPSGLWEAIERYADEADRDGRVAALAPAGGMRAALDSIHARLGRGPMEVTVTDEDGEEQSVRFTVFDFSGLADGYSSSMRARRSAAGWAADILRLYHGDFETAARLRLERRAGSGGGSSLPTASYFMLDCGSGITAERLEDYTSDPAIPRVGNPGSWYQMACRNWDADLGDAFRDYFDTDIPTAIVHGDRDMSTPYTNALELAPHFTAGKLVTVVGGSHGALREAMESRPEFADALWMFVRTGRLDVLPEQVELPPVEWEVPNFDGQGSARGGPSQ